MKIYIFEVNVQSISIQFFSVKEKTFSISLTEVGVNISNFF